MVPLLPMNAEPTLKDEREKRGKVGEEEIGK
jgi:hypothetical protein